MADLQVVNARYQAESDADGGSAHFSSFAPRRHPGRFLPEILRAAVFFTLRVTRKEWKFWRYCADGAVKMQTRRAERTRSAGKYRLFTNTMSRI